MQINIGQKPQQQNNEQPQVPSNGIPQDPNQGKVVLAQHMTRTRVMLDKFGNEIDPRTKQIIKKADTN